MKERYVINPGYSLIPDENRVLFVNQDNIDPGVKYEDNWTSYIHPFNAQLLAFFNGTDPLEEVVIKASGFFGLTVDEIGKIVAGYIENENSFSIPYNGSYMYFPANVLVDKTKINVPYKIYRVEDFILNGEVDLTSLRTSFPLALNLELTMKCHTDCFYCYANRKMHTKEMPLKTVISIIRQAKQTGVVNFDISGGEVLLHPHYKEIISELLANGYTPFISTKVPVKKDKLQTLKEIGIKEIQISLDSVNPETLSKILKVPTNYADEIKETIRLTEEIGLSLRVHTIINSHNCIDEEIENLVDFLTGFVNLKTLQFTPAGYSLYKEGLYEQFRPTKTFLERMNRKIDEFREQYPRVTFNLSEADFHEDYRYECRKKNFPERATCTGNMRSMVILPDGRVTICEELYDHPEFIIGDLTKNTIKEVWNSDKAKSLFFLSRQLISEKSVCKKCSQFDHCRQGRGVCWKMVMYAYGKQNWDYPDPRCPEAPQMFNDICII